MKKATELEKGYEWLQATDCHKEASSILLKEKELAKAAEFQERLGYCFFRAALQADTAKDFSNRARLAKEAYEKAVDFLQKTESPKKKVRVTDAKAMVAFYASLLQPIQSKKIKLLHEWWELKKEVVQTYDEAGESLAFARTCNDLLLDANFDLIWSERSKQQRMTEELVDYGEKSIEILSGVDSKYDLAWAYGLTSVYYSLLYFLRRVEDKREEDRKKSLNYIKKALELAENTGDGYLIGMLNLFASGRYRWVAEPFVPKFLENALEQAAITRNNYLKGLATEVMSSGSWILGMITDDRNKRLKLFKRSIEAASESICTLKIFNFSEQAIFTSYRSKTGSFLFSAGMETNLEARRNLIKQAVENGREGLKYMYSKDIQNEQILDAIGWSLASLARFEKKVDEKKRLLGEALNHLMNAASILQKEQQEISTYTFTPGLYAQIGIVQMALSVDTADTQKKTELLNSAFSSIEEGLRIQAKYGNFGRMALGLSGASNAILGHILNQLYGLTKKKETLEKAIGYFKRAIEETTKLERWWNTAAGYWQMAKGYDCLGDRLESAHNYQLASENYKLAAEKMPSLKEFYEDFSVYMQAWNEIEKAKHSHAIEEYEKAHQHYEKAAELHESTDAWNYLVPNYLAWANMEEAEGLSRRENTKQAKQTFQKAHEQFTRAEESMKQKLEEIKSTDEKDMVNRLLNASDLRRKYCQARILLEDAKLLDRQGKYLQSSKSYQEAAQNISAIVEKIDNEAERNELRYVAILCEAWGKMANAEETASSESYLEAAALFEHAKEYCFTQKASYWALGNSSFCKGLAAGIRYQNNVDLAEHARAKSLMKTAATSYLHAGFKTASEYAKATQRLFDAYLFMNQAESETDQEKRAKQYQLAEKMLQISAGSFLKAKQPEKTAQVKQILENVREEKELAVSLTEVLHAPTIASTTLSFTTPTSTSEVSVGLEQFDHANVQANLIAANSEVKVGESFCLTVEFVNAGKEPALLTRVEEFVPPHFVVVKKPETYRLEDTCLNMVGKELGALKLVEAKLVLQPLKKGVYELKPKVYYLDELGQNKSVQLKSVEIKVEEVVLPERLTTGTKELDSLLLGGIPNEYAVALTGPPSDEREMIIRNFLEAGIKEQQVTFFATSVAEGLADLLEQTNFYLFLCNSKPKAEGPDLPNIYELGGKTDLTNLGIALSKANRKIGQTANMKRFCVEIVSDVLLDFGAKNTRKWISQLITDMGSKGFTMLAVVNPLMHASEELHAILDLFDGEISITQTRDPLECRTSIRVEKLRNQDYIRNPICLTKK